MLTELKLYATCFFAIIIFDYIWLGFVMKKFYLAQLAPIGRIAGEKFTPVMWAACAVYVVFAVGIVQFVLPKLLPNVSVVESFGVGALFGFVIYAIYDFTNYSILKDYSLAVTFVDIAWGAVLGGMVATIARFVRDTLA